MKRLILALFFISMTFTPSFAGKILTVRFVLKEMQNSLDKLEDFRASFTLKNGDYKNFGGFYYKKPFYLRINGYRDKSKVVSNGKDLWIYIPKYEVISEQKLITTDEKHKKLLASPHKTLGRLKHDYRFKFARGGKNNKYFYILDLTPRITKIGFKKMRVWVSRTSKLITKIEAKTVNNKSVSLAFKNIKINTGLTKGFFEFEMPDENVQVIKNTILPKSLINK